MVSSSRLACGVAYTSEKQLEGFSVYVSSKANTLDFREENYIYRAGRYLRK